MAVFIPKIDGYILYANSYSTYAAGAVVKICTTPNPTSVYDCVAPVANSSGYYSVSNWSVGDGATLYFFPFKDAPHPDGRTGRWGNAAHPIGAAKACQEKNQYGWCKNYGLSASFSIYPSPLEPIAVNPAPNSTNVGLTQTMKWKSASDRWRTGSDIVYDIYGSGYDAPLLLQVADRPCNPDPSGNCQWMLPITLDPNTPYNWKIVARARWPYPAPTESAVYHFTTGY